MELLSCWDAVVVNQMRIIVSHRVHKDEFTLLSILSLAIM